MIKFCAHSAKDIPYRVKWLNNGKIARFFLDRPRHKTDLAEQTEWFRKYRQAEDKKFFTILLNNRPIGLVGLTKINRKKRSANVFIVIGDDRFRGKGIGKKAMDWLINYSFKRLGLKKLALEVKKINCPAVRLYQSCGFRKKKSAGKEFVMELTKK